MQPAETVAGEAPKHHLADRDCGGRGHRCCCQFMQAIPVPFVISGLLFYALDPAVDWMQRFKVPRVLGAALMLTIAVGGVAALAYSLQGRR
jgi:predicted PurR-regulated permease PerM